MGGGASGVPCQAVSVLILSSSHFACHVSARWITFPLFHDESDQGTPTCKPLAARHDQRRCRLTEAVQAISRAHRQPPEQIHPFVLAGHIRLWRLCLVNDSFMLISCHKRTLVAIDSCRQSGLVRTLSSRIPSATVCLATVQWTWAQGVDATPARHCLLEPGNPEVCSSWIKQGGCHKIDGMPVFE